MYEILEGLPDDVIGIKSKGQITHEDYEKVLIPLAEEKFEAHGKLKFLFILEDFDGADLRAMWDDTTFGLKHWRGFTHMAIVTDLSWVQSIAAMFAPMMPAEVRVFNGGEISNATDWVVSA